MGIDFLIVGAGIGGAVLANLLSRAGKEVLVLERESAAVVRVRPEVLWPATVHFLESILPVKLLHERALLPLQQLDVHYQGSQFTSFARETLVRAGVQPWSSDGDQTRALLLQQAACSVERGVEVLGLLHENGRVVGVRARPTGGGAEREILARWTVGDDGGHSAVRQGCGISMATHAVPLDLLSFGFTWPSFLEPATAQIWINRKRGRSGPFLVAAIPRPAGIGAGLLPVGPELLDDARRFEHFLKEFCDSEQQVAEIIGERRFPRDLVRVRLAWGHAERYGVDGAVLIGDAAHTVTPAGGQGANAAIADARALADVALADEAQLVDAYERRRRPANERSITPSRIVSRFVALPRFMLSPWIPTALRCVGWFPRLAARGLRFVSTAFLETAIP
jgi:2-polyprenyl-6-methoxyphenol hydroxylase-like FAD-dependent oxidoreductase